MDSSEYLFDSKERLCQFKINQKLYELTENIEKVYDRIAVVCIGTDAVTGDCFGPLVGFCLSKWSIYDFDLYGTIHNPVHAKNMSEVLSSIDMDRTLVIAVDACLGTVSHIGCIGLSYAPLKPGKGVGLNLPPVGDISIVGIVNIGGFLPQLVLQCTRLSVVYTMAEITSNAIRYMLHKMKKQKAVIFKTYGI